MTSEGSPYGRFRRALATGKLNLVHDAALELPQVDLNDALAIVLLMARNHDPRYDRAATRWLARLTLEHPTIRLDDLRAGLNALDNLPHNPNNARRRLRELCGRHRVDRAARLLG